MPDSQMRYDRAATVEIPHRWAQLLHGVPGEDAYKLQAQLMLELIARARGGDPLSVELCRRWQAVADEFSLTFSRERLLHADSGRKS